MRSSDQMFQLIVDVANSDERIRAVYMNGSRTNPAITPDRYQDFDIVYVVDETASFIAERSWIDVFGETAIVQEPDRNDWEWGEDSDPSRRYAWLMQFADGNRIDLTIQTLAHAFDTIHDDKLCVVLLDKDGVLPPIPAPTDVDYHIKPPTDGRYQACCNEFWWVMGYVAKGVARGELPYAMAMLNGPVRDMLNEMVEWSIGLDHAFAVSAGKEGRFFKRYLPPETYAALCRTYPAGDLDAVSSSMREMAQLFRPLAHRVGDHFGFAYPDRDDVGATAYIASLGIDLSKS